MNASPTPPLPPGRLTALGLLKQTWLFVNEHEVMTRASAIAFTAITASVPLLAMVLLVLLQILPDVTTFVPENTSLGALMLNQMLETLQAMFPPEAYKVVEEQIARMQEAPPVGLMSIGLVITIWCASAVFRGVIDAINRVYGITEQRPLWRVWLLSIWMTFIQTAILLGALLFIIAWPLVTAKLGIAGGSWLLTEGVRWFVVFSVIMLSFALAFHMGPDVPQRHRWVTPGAFVGTLLFLASCYGLKMYVQNFAHYDKTYGSLGGVMTLLLWYYVNSLVFLVAAEINRLCHYAVNECRVAREARDCRTDENAP
jgi:membrane protein